jgi:hypothetical protein
VLLYIIVLPFPSVYYFCKDSNDEPLEEEEEGEWSQGALTGALPTASSTQPLQAGSNGGMPVFFVVVFLFLFFFGGGACSPATAFAWPRTAFPRPFTAFIWPFTASPRPFIAFPRPLPLFGRPQPNPGC